MNFLIIAANVYGFLREIELPPRLLEKFLFTHGFIPARLWSGAIPLSASLATVAYSMFLHAGWLHILGNMLFLYIFGDNVEDRLGHGRYALFYFLCGYGAAFTHAFFNPLSRVPTLGASGAISGVLAAYFLLYPRARVVTYVPLLLFFTFEIPAVVFIFVWFVMQFFSGALSLEVATPTSGGTAYLAHVGGFVSGIVLLFVMRPPRRPGMVSAF